MDAAARLLGLDGVEIRRLNLARFGEDVVPGDVPADGDWKQSLERAAEMIGWDRPPVVGRGRGIAVAIKAGATTGLSQATVRLLFDGSVIVYAGTSDMGQGARTIFAQIAADEFGVTADDVSVVSGDTAIVPFDLQTSASRSTVFMGNAILAACEDVHRQLRSLAAEVNDVDVADIEIEDGHVHVDGEQHRIASLLASGLGRLRGELVGNGTMRREDDADHPLGGAPAFYEFNCTAFEVSVDGETGEVLIHRHVTVGDVGSALNPLQVTMQDEGAAVMGLGHSLMEQLLLDDQRPNPKPGSSRLPHPYDQGHATRARNRRCRKRRRAGAAWFEGRQRRCDSVHCTCTGCGHRRCDGRCHPRSSSDARARLVGPHGGGATPVDRSDRRR